MDLDEALAYLDDHVNLEAQSADGAALKLQTVARLVELAGDPQRQYPVIHLTGTNGKTSTARLLTGLLVARGLSVGTYTSPHLERVNERLAWNGEPIPDGAFVEQVEALAALEPLLAPARPTYFELVTAAALRWFADIAVDVAVIEVGLGGRYDATNVADGEVAVVTNVGLDHVQYIGPGRLDIAREKAGIVKPGSTLVLGETDPELTGVFRQAGAATVWERDKDFACEASVVAHGGRLVTLRTPGARYDEVYLPLHGAHQGENAAAALTAAEAFFATPLDGELVAAAFAGVQSPGRMEVLGRRPLLLLDGAHNPTGAAATRATVEEEFAALGARVLVVGMFGDKDPDEMLGALGAEQATLVVSCPPPWPRARPPEEVADAARRLGVATEVIPDVGEALARARAVAGPEGLVLVTGSLYLVGAARAALGGN